MGNRPDLITSLPDLHTLKNSCFLLSKTLFNSGQPHKKLQGIFGAGEVVVNVTSMCSNSWPANEWKTDIEGSITKGWWEPGKRLGKDFLTKRVYLLPEIKRALQIKQDASQAAQKFWSKGARQIFTEQLHKSFLLLRLVGATIGPGTFVTKTQQKDTPPC